MARRSVGDVAHLGLGDIEEPGKLGPIRGRLVEQDQELAVGEHEPGGVGTQALLYILGGPRHGGGVLPKPLPALVEKLGRIEILKEQVNFVDEYPCVLSRQAICCHPVLNGLHRDGQGGGLELFPIS